MENNNNLSISSEAYKGSPIGSALESGVQENYLTKAQLDEFIGDTVSLAMNCSSIGDDLLEKAQRDLSKLTRKEVWVTKNGKTYKTTVWVSNDLEQEVKDTKLKDNIAEDLNGVFIQKYSDKAILVGGDTKENLETLRDIKKETGVGRFNAKLKGWVFPITQAATVIGKLMAANQDKENKGGEQSVEAAEANVSLNEMRTSVPAGTPVQTPIGKGKVVSVSVVNGKAKYTLRVDSGRTVKGLTEEDFTILPADDKTAAETINNGTPESRNQAQKVIGGSPSIKDSELSSVPESKLPTIKDLQSKRDSMIKRLKNLSKAAKKPKGEGAERKPVDKSKAGERNVMSKAELNSKLEAEGMMGVEAYYQAVFGEMPVSGDESQRRADAMRGNQNAKKDGSDAKEPEKTHKYKLGDKYRSDFDVDGMLDMLETMSDKTRNVDNLKMADSLEDMNYHTLAGLVRKGQWEKVKQELKQLNEDVNPFVHESEKAQALLDSMFGHTNSDDINSIVDVDNKLFYHAKADDMDLVWNEANTSVSLVDGDGKVIIPMTTEAALVNDFKYAMDNGYFTKVKEEVKETKSVAVDYKKIAEGYLDNDESLTGEFFKLSPDEQQKVLSEVANINAEKNSKLNAEKNERESKEKKSFKDFLTPLQKKNMSSTVERATPQQLEALKEALERKISKMYGQSKSDEHTMLNMINPLIEAHKKADEHNKSLSEAMMGNDNAKKDGSDAKEPEKKPSVVKPVEPKEKPKSDLDEVNEFLKGKEKEKKESKGKDKTKSEAEKVREKQSKVNADKNDKQEEVAGIKGVLNPITGRLSVDANFEIKNIKLKNTSGVEVEAIDMSSVDVIDMQLFNVKNVLDYDRPNYIPSFSEQYLLSRSYEYDSVLMPDGTYLVQNVIKDPNDRYGKGTQKNYIMNKEQYAVMKNYYIARKKAENNIYDDKQNISKQAAYDAQSEEYKERYKFKPYKSKRVSVLSSNKYLLSQPRLYKEFVNKDADRKEIMKMVLEHRDISTLAWNNFSVASEDYSGAFHKGKKTSYSKEGSFEDLKKDYGINIKNQNGSVMGDGQVKDISDAMDSMFEVFGDRSSMAKNWDLTVSHSGEKLQHASKALGMFVPGFKAIGVTMKLGKAGFGFTLAHEFAHFMDYYVAEKEGKEGGTKRRFASHDSNSSAGKVADTFRNHLNDPSLKGHKYWGNSHECFARAMEQYFAQESKTGMDKGEGLQQVKMDTFNKEVKPLIEAFLKEKNSLLKSIMNELNTFEG